MFLVMGPKFRPRSAGNVVDEIELLYDRYGINHLNIMDDNFTFDKQRVLDICFEIQRRRLDIQFETLNGVMLHKMDKEVIDAMASAGWVRGALSIESGSDFIRNDVMGKHLPKEKIYEVVRLIREHPSIRLKGCFVIGMPEDTLQTLEDTYTMIEEIDIDEALVANLVPYPGTRVYDQCLKDDLFIDLDIKTLWKFDALYPHPGNKRFFVKPYSLSLEDLIHFRKRIDELCDRKMKKMA
jgi:radical SAM superfamily enzyme YgiQ (UPF0313 family)